MAPNSSVTNIPVELVAFLEWANCTIVAFIQNSTSKKWHIGKFFHNNCRSNIRDHVIFFEWFWFDDSLLWPEDILWADIPVWCFWYRKLISSGALPCRLEIYSNFCKDCSIRKWVSGISQNRVYLIFAGPWGWIQMQAFPIVKICWKILEGQEMCASSLHSNEICLGYQFWLKNIWPFLMICDA